MRPNGKPDECFYCQAKVATEHKEGCVIRLRTVVVQRIITMVISEPEAFEESTINFKYEGTHCADNLVSDLEEVQKRMEVAGRCMCGMVEQKYIREATRQDEEEHQLFVKDFKA